jgi:hypothetical protein
MLIERNSEMSDFVRFSASTTPIKLENVAGMLNGYKINEFTHGGRTVSVRKQHYFYIPVIRAVVTYKATTARVMAISKTRKFSFRETLENGYAKNVQVDASVLFQSAAQVFN